MNLQGQVPWIAKISNMLININISLDMAITPTLENNTNYNLTLCIVLKFYLVKLDEQSGLS